MSLPTDNSTQLPQTTFTSGTPNFANVNEWSKLGNIIYNTSLNSIGIGTTNPNGFKLNVLGTLKASYYYGDGANITNLSYENINGKPSYFPADWNTTISNKPSTFPADMTNIYTKTETDGRYLKLTGGTLSGAITIPNINLGEHGKIKCLDDYHYIEFGGYPTDILTIQEYGTISFNIGQTKTQKAYINSSGLTADAYYGNGANLTNLAYANIDGKPSTFPADMTNIYNKTETDLKYTQSNFTPSFTQLNSCNYITNSTTGLTNYTRTGLDSAYLLKSGGTLSGTLTLPTNSWSIKTADNIDRIYFNNGGTTYFHSGNTNGDGFKFRSTAQTDIMTLTDAGALTASSFSGTGTNISALDYNKITLNKPTNFQSDWNTTIINKPTNFQSDWNTTIINKPIIYTQTETNNLLNTKQATLTASTNLLGIGSSISALDYTKITIGKPTNFQADWLTTIINKPSTFPADMTTIYTKTESDGRYLQLSGGTMTGAISGATTITTNFLNCIDTGIPLTTTGRNLNLVGANAVMRIWRNSTFSPSLEFLWGPTTSATSYTTFWDMYIGTTISFFAIRDRAGGGGINRLIIDGSGNVGIGTTTNASYKLNIEGALTASGNIACGGGISLVGANAFYNTGAVTATNITNTFLSFKGSGAGNDWAYLRNIGGDESIKLALDFHDDADDARFCIRSVASVTEPDTIKEVFTIDNGNVSCSGNITCTGGILKLNSADYNISGQRGIIFRNGYDTANNNNYNCSILTYDHDGNTFADGLSINAYDGISFCTGANTRVERMKINVNGNVSIGNNLTVTGIGNINNGSPYATANNFMASGSLTIGGITLSYGTATGWSTNTAGLLMECEDYTEIAIHDAGSRVASVMYYDGPNNRIYMGRDKGWGKTAIYMSGGLIYPASTWLYSSEVNQRIYWYNSGTSLYQGYGNDPHIFWNGTSTKILTLYNNCDMRCEGEITTKCITISGSYRDLLGVYAEYTSVGSIGYYTHKVIEGTFTGFHRCFTDDELYNSEESQLFKEQYEGRVVIATGKIATDTNTNDTDWTIEYDKAGITIEDALPIIQLSRIKKDKRVFGVVGASRRKNSRPNKLIINSVGEGAMWICSSNGNIENGDYIQSSDHLGYGERQDDDILHNYSVAKATMDCNFELDSPLYECRELDDGLRVAFIAVTYHCG